MSDQSTLAVGDSVSVICYVDATPRTVTGRVASLEPFVVESRERLCERLEGGMRATVLHRSGRYFTKAETTIGSCAFDGEIWSMSAAKAEWQMLDRRRYPRFDVAIPARIRAVHEGAGVVEFQSFEATTGNVSLGGVWIDSDAPAEEGTLVEIQLELKTGESARAFGVVAWADNERAGYGVEFLEFFGASRYYLHTFLSKAA